MSSIDLETSLDLLQISRRPFQLKLNVIVILIDLAKSIIQARHISKHIEIINNKVVSIQKLKEILQPGQLYRYGQHIECK